MRGGQIPCVTACSTAVNTASNAAARAATILTASENAAALDRTERRNPTDELLEAISELVLEAVFGLIDYCRAKLVQPMIPEKALPKRTGRSSSPCLP